ncbi:polyamine aminopropyltransferase [Shewanella sp. NIFS-20-20]|uniref:polyamine aminopropyltransferase n=1 Tax=Shewanella sp. NIFS-20-20 TaxID=2853806 RepID=UPI001C4722A2|nr:polyamine aminopropyltransferase [Shewanella sp. NIFS-20-20]MBV7314687.1 polyamine aminopropyltransferase [Shewanella sp. NIFS-20-20]
MDASSASRPAKLALIDDILLLLIMAVLAACGLIYEYLLSHYAGRILGAMEAAIYTMIGLMIVFMGIGAFAARGIRDPFSRFAELELALAFIGSTSVLMIAAAIGLTQSLPAYLADVLFLPTDMLPNGSPIKELQALTSYLPYVFGAILGLMIGMEIPLIARVRQALCEQHLLHNAGTIYGADYIGAGLGAAVWVSVMLSMDIQLAAALTASINLLAGLIFLIRFWHKICYPMALAIGHGILAVLVVVLIRLGPGWQQDFNNLIYRDQVVFNQASRFAQHTITERLRGSGLPPVYSLYLNGRLQFASDDEHIYHSFLVQPAMHASARQQEVLIIGGGDGLALRDILNWQPNRVTLIDLDQQLVELFRQPHVQSSLPTRVASALSQLNQNALNDPRVELMFDDAFNGVDTLLAAGRHYDVIIVDLPDPSHPDLNKLYSDAFYLKLRYLLNADGAMAVQSTSPFHARKAFVSIGLTLAEAGFRVDQYQYNVPSFGQWGWTLATLSGASGRERLSQQHQLQHGNDWLSLELMQASFAAPASLYSDIEQVKINHLGSMTLYQYHQEAWQEQTSGLGLF